jgi:hypothetical protein
MPYADVLAIPVGGRIFWLHGHTKSQLSERKIYFGVFTFRQIINYTLSVYCGRPSLRSGIFNGTSCPKMSDEPCTLGPMKLWNGK